MSAQGLRAAHLAGATVDTPADAAVSSSAVSDAHIADAHIADAHIADARNAALTATLVR